MQKRLTRTRRARLAAALEASEHPSDLPTEEAVYAATSALQAAARSLRALDPVAYAKSALKMEIDRRLKLLVARRDELREIDKRQVVARVLSLAALGRAAGYPVMPCSRDLKRVRSLVARGSA